MDDKIKWTRINENGGYDADGYSYYGWNRNGHQRIHEAAIQGHWQKVQDQLTEWNVNLLTKDEQKRSLLHFAASHRNEEPARFLLEHKADVNQRDSDGMTPLAIAIQSKSDKCVRLLMDHKADTKHVAYEIVKVSLSAEEYAKKFGK